MKIEINQEELDTLCICAIRYCHGRRTYMPSTVMDIVDAYLQDLSDRAINVMHDDCRFMLPADYGDEMIDKPKWLAWERMLKAEKQRRIQQQ